VDSTNAEPDLAPDACLGATAYIDAGHPLVVALAERVTRGVAGDQARAVALYRAVRDEVRYEPYNVEFTHDGMRGSRCLETGHGFCVTKAVLLAAAGRAAGIPSRLGFADVRNHLTTAKLRESMGTDLFVFHGYTEFHLNDRWVKATPAFNLSLCEKFGVRPLEFDGLADSVFHPFDAAGRRHMEYVEDHGSYADLPFDEIRAAWTRVYGHDFSAAPAGGGRDFAAEAEAERRGQP
jgi:transglutaminase-like putative cysteine protease